MVSSKEGGRQVKSPTIEVSRSKFPTAASKALLIASIVFVVLVSASAAPAATYKILHSFGNGSGGVWPYGNLISDPAGNLYGTTYGINGAVGAVFELTPNSNGTWTETVLHTFTGPDGKAPFAGLIFDDAGNLYGTTAWGGVSCALGECGLVFKLTPNSNGTWTETVLHYFTGGDDGGEPYAGLISDAAGNLYGTTYYGGGSGCGGTGCGTVFKLSPNSDSTWTESVIYSFTGNADGGLPIAGLILDKAGNLYGTTVFAGDVAGACCGVVFELTPNSNGTWTETVLHTFMWFDGRDPWTGVILDKAGNLYGTTRSGGAFPNACNNAGCGVVYRLTHNSNGTWTNHVLHSFTGGNDGGVPAGGLTLDTYGNLYGTTTIGGYTSTECSKAGCGVVFQLTAGRWTERVLHTFWGYAATPQASLLIDSAGNLYGTAQGTPGNGVVFKITHLTLDQSFNSPTNLGSSINDCCAFIGQTYTAGKTGVLTGVAVDVESTSLHRLHVAIRTVASGLPTTTILGEVTLGSSASNLSQVIVFPHSIPQVAGVQYAIVVSYPDAPPQGSAQGVWRGSTADGYSRGDLVASSDGGTSFYFSGQNDADVHFKTYVSPIQ
jgi:hypothetical protein